MSFALSNLSVCSAALTATTAASAAEVAETTTAEPVMSETVIALLAVGSCLALVWLVRRIIYPRKLSLSHAPGRPHKLNAIHGVVLLTVLVMISAFAPGMMMALFGLPEPKAIVLGLMVDRVAWLGISLPVAALAFRFGLMRGMGLSVRHWIYDSIRAAYAYLAVLPLCLGLQALTTLLVPPKQHPIFEIMGGLPPYWQATLALTTAVLVPISEEVFFRGLLQSIARRHLQNAWAAVIAISAVFAMLHAATPQDIPSLFVLSLVLGYTYERSGRLLSPILIHMVFNGVFVALFLAHTG
ncbi:MAG: CPBP family intramembrane glutamic endopeptidase [Phycisphaerae bacterium]